MNNILIILIFIIFIICIIYSIYYIINNRKKISNTNLSNTNLSNTNLSNTNLSNTNLSNTNLSNTTMYSPTTSIIPTDIIPIIPKPPFLHSQSSLQSNTSSCSYSDATNLYKGLCIPPIPPGYSIGGVFPNGLYFFK